MTNSSNSLLNYSEKDTASVNRQSRLNGDGNADYAPINPALDGVGPFGFCWFVVKNGCKGILKMFSIKGLVSMGLMALLWYGLAIAKLKWPNSSWVYVASLLTFAQGGLYGGLLGAAGGVLGKSFLGSAFIRMMIGPTGSANKTFAKGTSWRSSLGSWILGLGAGLILFNFTDINMLRENSIIGLIMFVICLKMQKDPGNLTIGFLNSFKKGRPVNPRAAKYFIAGTGWGFLLGFSMVWVNYFYPKFGVMINTMHLSFRYLAYQFGLLFALLGAILFFMHRKGE